MQSSNGYVSWVDDPNSWQNQPEHEDIFDRVEAELNRPMRWLKRFMLAAVVGLIVFYGLFYPAATIDHNNAVVVHQHIQKHK